MILGGLGYLGHPTALHFSNRGHEVTIVDNDIKRHWESQVGAQPLFPIPFPLQRLERWRQVRPNAAPIKFFASDIAKHYSNMDDIMRQVMPDVIIHYAEQPSAPFSMISPSRAAETFTNNCVGTLFLLHAMKNHCPNAHLVKLGTMGEYGTPNIPIEEGWIEIEHKGKKDRLPFPKMPGSFYHASKVADSTFIEFTCRAWGIRATDLNQGVVYGVSTEETDLHQELTTSFHYDSCFGTVLNRFIVQAVIGHPLTVYGDGGQTRGFLNIRDTIQCVEIAVNNPAGIGEFRVLNQFTEIFSVKQLAEMVARVGEKELGSSVKIKSIPNPRVEKEAHLYDAANSAFFALGLNPVLLTDEVIASMISRVEKARTNIQASVILPQTKWRQKRELRPATAMVTGGGDTI